MWWVMDVGLNFDAACGKLVIHQTSHALLVLKIQTKAKDKLLFNLVRLEGMKGFRSWITYRHDYADYVQFWLAK